MVEPHLWSLGQAAQIIHEAAVEIEPTQAEGACEHHGQNHSGGPCGARQLALDPHGRDRPMLQSSGKLVLDAPHLGLDGRIGRRGGMPPGEGGEVAHHLVYVGMDLGAVEDGQVQRHAAPSAPG